jgi:hypothetical protein
VLLTFISLFVFNSNTPAKYPILLLLSVVAYLIHPIFLFTYFPVIASLLIYSIYENNYSKKVIITVGISLISIIIFFFYTFLWIKNSLTTEELMSYLSSKTNMKIHQPAVYYEEVATISEHITDWVWVNIVHSTVGFIVTLLLLSPLFYLFYKIWKIAYKNAEKKKKGFSLLCFFVI